MVKTFQFLEKAMDHQESNNELGVNNAFYEQLSNASPGVLPIAKLQSWWIAYFGYLYKINDEVGVGSIKPTYYY